MCFSIWNTSVNVILIRNKKYEKTTHTTCVYISSTNLPTYSLFRFFTTHQTSVTPPHISSTWYASECYTYMVLCVYIEEERNVYERKKMNVFMKWSENAVDFLMWDRNDWLTANQPTVSKIFVLYYMILSYGFHSFIIVDWSEGLTLQCRRISIRASES